MLDKLAEINGRFEKLTDELAQPDVVQDQERYRKLSQEHSSIQEIVECYRSFLKIQNEKFRFQTLKFAILDPKP